MSDPTATAGSAGQDRIPTTAAQHALETLIGPGAACYVVESVRLGTHLGAGKDALEAVVGQSVVAAIAADLRPLS